jgi:hypothetical protein
MLFPEWKIRLSKECQEKWEKLKEETILDIHRGSWTPHPLRSIATPDAELDALEAFGKKITKLIEQGKDPFWTLPKHRDKYFDNVYYYNKPPWCCYFYRRLKSPPRVLGVLLVHELDKPQDLRAALEAAITRAKAEDDLFQY